MPQNSNPAMNNLKIMAEVTARCCQDESYRKTFMANPLKTFAEAGMTLPGHIKIKVYENTDKITYAILPFSLSPNAIMQVISQAFIHQGLAQGLSEPGRELRFVQNTPTLMNFIIPYAKNFSGELDMNAMANVAGGTGQFQNMPSITGPGLLPITIIGPMGPLPMVMPPVQVVLIGPTLPVTLAV